MREACLPAATELCSVSIALAASSARMLSAAWAPIASDTMPIRAAAKAVERREMRNWATFITVHSWSLTKARFLVAPASLRFEGIADRGHVQLCSIFGTAAGEPLTCEGLSGNLVDIFQIPHFCRLRLVGHTCEFPLKSWHLPLI